MVFFFLLLQLETCLNKALNNLHIPPHHLHLSASGLSHYRGHTPSKESDSIETVSSLIPKISISHQRHDTLHFSVAPDGSHHFTTSQGIHHSARPNPISGKRIYTSFTSSCCHYVHGSVSLPFVPLKLSRQATNPTKRCKESI